MKMSVLQDKCVNADKGGTPVYIEAEMEFATLDELIPYLKRHHVAISIFDPGYRCGKNWKSLDVFTADIDNGETSAEIHTQLVLLKLTHLIMASTNHLKDKGDGVRERFHVFIPLSKTILDPNLYGHLARCFTKDRGWKVDMKATVDKCRYYYKHGDGLFYYVGNPLDVTPYEKLVITIQRIRQDAASKLKPTPPLFKKSLYYIKRSKYWKDLSTGLQTAGFRHDTAKKAFWFCIVNKVSKGDALDLVIDEMGQHGIDTQDDLNRLYDWMAERTTVVSKYTRP